MTDEPDGAPQGGPVAGQDPDAIQRQIEQTRAELADTIDAIADRVSPKRMASRGMSRVKAAFGAEPGPNGAAPRAVLDVRPPARALPPSDYQVRAAGVAEERAGGAYAGTSAYTVERRLRPERVLVAVGAVAAVTAVVIYLRSRR